jgi:putative spermidine/putrescine transport system substrate-binding protein
MNFLKGTRRELPGKLKAQWDANKVDIDLAMCGCDGMTTGIERPRLARAGQPDRQGMCT